MTPDSALEDRVLDYLRDNYEPTPLEIAEALHESLADVVDALDELLRKQKIARDR